MGIVNKMKAQDRVKAGFKNINNATLKRSAYMKVGKADVEKSYSNFVKDFDKVSKKQFYELIALDDWSTIAQWALPYIMEYGPKAV